jgi:hypothetical protein
MKSGVMQPHFTHQNADNGEVIPAIMAKELTRRIPAPAAPVN